jgi:hypothetical protein
MKAKASSLACRVTHCWQKVCLQLEMTGSSATSPQRPHMLFFSWLRVLSNSNRFEGSNFSAAASWGFEMRCSCGFQKQPLTILIADCF